MKIGACAHLGSDVVEFGDKSVFYDVNDNFRGNDHEDIREHDPEVVCRKKQQCKFKFFIRAV